MDITTQWQRIYALTLRGFVMNSIGVYKSEEHPRFAIKLDLVYDFSDEQFANYIGDFDRYTKVEKAAIENSTHIGLSPNLSFIDQGEPFSGATLTLDTSKGLRYNTGKPKWNLIDFKSLEPMVKVMEYGANKYAPHNWKKGMSHTEVAECLMRHLFAYLAGEDTDPESGESHIGHVQANAMFLQYNIQNHPGLDDRYKQHTING